MDNEQTVRCSCLGLAASLASSHGLSPEETVAAAATFYAFVSGTDVPPVATSKDDIPF